MRRGSPHRRGRRSDLAADDIAGNHQLYAAILLPASGILVGSHRLGFSEAASRDGALRYSLAEVR